MKKLLIHFPVASRLISAIWTLVVALVLFPGSSARAGELNNLSTRGSVGTGENVLIGGIIITGSGTKHVILEALGASLSNVGVPADTTLQDPILDLFKTNDRLQSNDDWRYGPELEIEASGLAPSDDYEAVIIADLNPGNYTAIISGYAHSSGISVIEAFDAGGATSARLSQISTRGNVQLGNDLLIGGFIIAQSQTKVLLRAIGPELKAFGVSNALENPILELRDESGALLEGNDDWRTDHEKEISDTGIPPKDDRESAIVRTLPPGLYTALVRGKANTTGIGLVEIYRLE